MENIAQITTMLSGLAFFSLAIITLLALLFFLVRKMSLVIGLRRAVLVTNKILRNNPSAIVNYNKNGKPISIMIDNHIKLI